jgi:hypothetical protein
MNPGKRANKQQISPTAADFAATNLGILSSQSGPSSALVRRGLDIESSPIAATLCLPH